VSQIKVSAHQEKKEVAKDLLKIIEGKKAKAHAQLFKTSGDTPSRPALRGIQIQLR
jgi:hypothetical protein